MDALTIEFPPFRLDLEGGHLLRGREEIPLRRRTWEVLCYLARRPGRLVTKDELLDAVWADATVSEVTLSTSIRELRVVLGDDARAPRFIQTVHRRGFRFVAAAAGQDRATAEEAASAPAQSPRRITPGAHLVGRDADLSELRAALDLAASAKPGVVFVRGEAGIGKTSLIRAFIAGLAPEPSLSAIRVARGHCGRFLKGSPPFLPVVEALEGLASSPAGDLVLAALETHTPEILDQMPWLLERSARPLAAAADDRRSAAVRLRDVLLEIASDAPLVLVLEDLHDADSSTVELLGELAATGRRASLLVVASYRVGEAIVDNPLLTELVSRIVAGGSARAIDLALLDEAAVRSWLQDREATFWTADRCARVHRRSGGNALFMVAIAGAMETAAADGSDAADAAVPDSLQALLQGQLRRLDPGQREVLAAASVEGQEISALAVSAATGLAIEDVEATLESLAASGRFVRRAGIVDWPSGGVGQAYAFVHELYRRALYVALPASRRAALHLRIADALETGFAGAAAEVAARLADHYERGGNVRKAVAWLREAATMARARSAHREALRLLDGALGLLQAERAWEEHDQWEFRLHVDRTSSTSALYGQGSAQARLACEKAVSLGRDLEPSVERFFNLLLLFQYQIVRSDVHATTRIADEMTRMAEILDAPLLRLGATSCTAMVQTTRGEFAAAREGFEQALAGTPREFRMPNFRDVLVPVLTGTAQNLCYLGEEELALDFSRQAIERADWLDDSFERACARVYDAHCKALLGDREGAARAAAAGADVAREHGIDEMVAIADIVGGWADASSGRDARLARVRRGIDGLDRTGHLIGKGFYLSLLAELEMEAADHAAARSTLEAALAFSRETGARRHDAEVLRLMAIVEEAIGAGRTEVDRRLEGARQIALAQANRLALGRLAAA